MLKKRYFLLVYTVIYFLVILFLSSILILGLAAVSQLTVSSTDNTNNVTYEPLNFTHLNMSQQGIYSKLALYYNFDNDNNLTAIDLSDNSKDGNYSSTNVSSNNSDCLSGFGSCLHTIGGVTDRGSYINIPGYTSNLANLGQNRTWSVWFKIQNNSVGSSTLNQHIVTGSNNGGGLSGTFIGFNSGSNVTTCGMVTVSPQQIRTDTNYTIPSSELYNWHNVVCVWDLANTTDNTYNQNVSIYVDGVLRDSRNYTGAFTVSSVNVYIGGNGGSATKNSMFNGSIDEVMIFNSTLLNSSDVLSIFNNQSARFARVGYQSTNVTTINMTSGYDAINISVSSIQNYLSTNVSLAISYFNGSTWNITSPQNITLANTNYSFNISATTTNISLNWTFTSDSNKFYSPAIGGTIILQQFSLDGVVPNVSLNTPVNAFNTTNQNITFNFTAVDNYPVVMNCSLTIDSTVRSWNLTVSNNTLTNFNVSSISQGTHNWNVTCVDGAGNSNTSSTRSFTVDYTPPNITNVLFFPNVSDDVDPYKNVTFNVTVSDDLLNISAVILQIRNATAWFNTSMYRFSGNVFQANLTLIPTEQIYSYNIYANDTIGNANVTVNSTFNSSWDCNWNVTPVSLSAITGYFADKYIGNVTIINRGDAAFTNNNCTLNFTTSYSGFSSSYSSIAFNNPSDWASNSRGLQLLSSVTYVNASTNYTLLVNASFPRVSTPLQESPTFNILSNIANNTNSSNNITVTATVVITPPGPYLYQAITTVPSTIYLTNQSTTFGAYIQNLAGNDTINNTAFNVSFNWTLPSQLASLTIDGNQSNLYNKLENNSLIFNNITLNFTSSNLPSKTPTTVSVRIYSFGYTNATGSLALINHANNATLIIQESNITLACYNVSDSICVTACGNTLDPDCTSSSSSSSSSGGGGGGGAAGGGSSASTSEELQLVRGKQNEIKVNFLNRNGATALTDLSFTLSGKLAKYIAVYPSTWDYLGPGQSMTLTLKVLSPTYIELGKQNIDVLIAGKLGDIQYNEIKSLLLQVQDISPAEARELIAQDKASIAKLASINLSIDNLNKLLKDSEDGLSNFNYAKIIENHATIEKNVNAALDASKIITEIQSLIDDSKARGISTSGSQRLIKLAELSLQRGDYEDAISRAKEAQVTYALEVKGEFSTVGYYLKNNKKEIALGILFLVVFSFGGYKLTELQILNNRIRRLKEEEKILTELIKVLQIETFREKKMDISEYQQGMLQYENRIAEVIEKLIESENKKANVLHFRSEVKKLQIERENMITLVKELQTDYLKRGTIENKVYELKLNSYNKRIAEIDQKMASREAEKALKGLSFFKKD